MADISAGDFKNGLTIEMEGNVYQVIEFQTSPKDYDVTRIDIKKLVHINQRYNGTFDLGSIAPVKGYFQGSTSSQAADSNEYGNIKISTDDSIDKYLKSFSKNGKKYYAYHEKYKINGEVEHIISMDVLFADGYTKTVNFRFNSIQEEPVLQSWDIETNGIAYINPQVPATIWIKTKLKLDGYPVEYRKASRVERPWPSNYTLTDGELVGSYLATVAAGHLLEHSKSDYDMYFECRIRINLYYSVPYYDKTVCVKTNSYPSD